MLSLVISLPDLGGEKRLEAMDLKLVSLGEFGGE